MHRKYFRAQGMRGQSGGGAESFGDLDISDIFGHWHKFIDFWRCVFCRCEIAFGEIGVAGLSAVHLVEEAGMP